MTTAIKLNPRKLLSSLAKSNGSGCLELNEGLVSWKIYLHQGNIQYVSSSVQMLDRLKYHLHFFGWKQAIAGLKKLPQSFMKLQLSLQEKSPTQNIYSKIISWLLAEGYLDLSQTLKLIKNITKDEIQSCIWLDRGVSTWHEEEPLPSWIPLKIRDSLYISVAECLNEAQVRLRQWQNCSPELLSVYQRPYFPPGWETKSLPASGSLNLRTLTELTQVLRGRTSIRQLSILLKKDEFQVAQILSPYIDEKIIYLHHAASPLDKLPHIPRSIKKIAKPLSDVVGDDEMTLASMGKQAVKTWKIVCIDDSPTILSEIQRFLGKDKFQVTAINDPIQAVSIIFKVQPDLILLDITMPRINGYKLCGLLRSSGKCDDVPIIMVTGNTGLIDKARARLAGATDYFTKPFTKEGLNEIVKKNLQ